MARRLADIPESNRITVYMANPNLATYGRGKYTGLMMERAGARNVAREIVGFKQVTMEDGCSEVEPFRHLCAGALSCRGG